MSGVQSKQWSVQKGDSPSDDMTKSRRASAAGATAATAVPSHRSAPLADLSYTSLTHSRQTRHVNNIWAVCMRTNQNTHTSYFHKLDLCTVQIALLMSENPQRATFNRVNMWGMCVCKVRIMTDLHGDIDQACSSHSLTSNRKWFQHSVTV